MRDDPARPHHDPDFAFWHDWEIEHLVDKLCRDFPNKTRPVIERIVERCRETISSFFRARDTHRLREEESIVGYR